ncbi:cytochrome P450 monooxygenase 9 [Geranomyces michiganensis]|nr:cytochrome P450 monooxygenase 9 [Geranomyces michiganensis]
MTYFKPNSRTNSWSAKPNPRLELLELTAKVVLATVQAFLLDYPVVRAIFVFVFAMIISIVIWTFVPFYRKEMNYFKFILSVEFVWAAVCLLPVVHYNSDSAGNTAMIVFFAGTPVAAAIGFFLFRMRWRQTVEAFAPKGFSKAGAQGSGMALSADDVEGGAGQVIGEQDAAEIGKIQNTAFSNANFLCLATRFLHQESTAEEIHRAELIFRRGIELFPDQPMLLVQAALFFTAYKDDNAMAIMLCQKVLKANPPLDAEFTVFYLRRGGIFDSKNGAPRLDLVDQLDFKHLNKRAKNYHDEAKRKIGLFWKQLLIDQPQSVQIRMLNDLASQINKAERRAQSAYEQLCSKYVVGRHWIAYANFVEEVQNDVKLADEIYAQYEAAQAENDSGDDLDERDSSAAGSAAWKGGRRRSLASSTKIVTRLGGISKRERRAYREYHRQVLSLKSQALIRMGAITKALVVVLSAVALAEFLYCVVISKNILGKIDTVVQSSYRREAAVKLPAILRKMQAAAIAGNLTEYAKQQAAGIAIVQPLPELQRLLFFENMRDATQMNLWTNPSINVTHLMATAANGTNIYKRSYINLFDASTLMSSMSTLALALPAPQMASKAFLGIYEPWFFTMLNVPNAIAGSFSVSTFQFVNSVRQQTQLVLVMEEYALTIIAVAVLLSGLLLFSPTMRKVEAERELSLKAFTKIPKSVAEAIHLKYTHGVEGNVSGIFGGDDDDINNSDSEDEEEDEYDGGATVETSHAAVYRRMSRRIWTALFMIIVLFAGFFVGSHFTMLPLVDITTRLNLALRIRFGALRADYMVTELILNDTFIYPEPKSMMTIVAEDISPLVLGVAVQIPGAEVVVDSQLNPEVQSRLFAEDPVTGQSINSAMILLDGLTGMLAIEPVVTESYVLVGYVRTTAAVVSEGMADVAAMLRALFVTGASRARAVTGAIFAGIVIALLFIYMRVFRKMVRMLKEDKRSTMALLLLIPPQTAVELDIIKSLSQTEPASAFGWIPQRIRTFFARAATHMEDNLSDQHAKDAEHEKGSLKLSPKPVDAAHFVPQISLTEVERGYGESRASTVSDAHRQIRSGAIYATAKMSDRSDSESDDQRPVREPSPVMSNENVFLPEEQSASHEQQAGGRRRPRIDRSASTPLIGGTAGDRQDLRAIPEQHGSGPVNAQTVQPPVGRSALRNSVTVTSANSPRKNEGDAASEDADSSFHNDDVKIDLLERDLKAALSHDTEWRNENVNEFRQIPGAPPGDLEYHEPTTPDDDIYMDEGPFADIVAKLLRKRYPNRAAPFSRILTVDDAEYLTTELRNFRVVTTHNPEFRRRYCVWGIDRRPATEIRLPLTEQQLCEQGMSEGPTVATYLKQRYGVELTLQNAPCIAVKKMQGMTYLPIEFCEMVPSQLKCTKDFEPKDPAMMWQTSNADSIVVDSATGVKKAIKKKKTKALSGAGNFADGVSNATDQDTTPAAEAIVEEQQDIDQNACRVPVGQFGVPSETWKLRKEINVCLRCGHPSHRLLECELYGTSVQPGASDWKDVPSYVATGMEIPTQPKIRLSKRCGISNTQWHRRLEIGLCGRCAHPGHGLRECALLKDPEFAYDGSRTWLDVPEYLSDSKPGNGPDYGRIPNGFIWENGRFWSKDDDHLDVAVLPVPLQKPAPSTIENRQFMKAEAATPDVGSEKEISIKVGKSDADKDLPVADYEKAESTDIIDRIPDSNGYVHLDLNGKLKKKTVKTGFGPLIAPLSQIQVHYTGWILGEEDTDTSHRSAPFESSRTSNPVEFIYGDGQVLAAWDQVIGTMRPGEQVEIICSHEYAYGDQGLDDKVAPYATLLFELEVLDVTPPPDPIKVRFADAQNHKARGNEDFKAGNFILAQEAYEEALRRLGPSWGSTIEDSFEIDQLRAALNANLALSYLRTNDCAKAFAAAKEGLLSAPRSAKLWYRQAQAAKGLKQWDVAAKAAETARELNPNDRDIVSFLAGIPAARKAVARTEQHMYAAMLGLRKGD